MKMKEEMYNPARGMTHEEMVQAQMSAMKPKARMQGRRPSGINPNIHEAWLIPLSQLVSLWQIKYGDKWIDVSDLTDEFWSEASKRLHRADKFEACDNDSTPWARLKEDA